MCRADLPPALQERIKKLGKRATSSERYHYINQLLKQGKLFYTIPEMLNHPIHIAVSFRDGCPSATLFFETLLESEVVEYDEAGNWIFRKRDNHAQTRHIVCWE
jgi:hypothetical protein